MVWLFLILASLCFYFLYLRPRWYPVYDTARKYVLITGAGSGLGKALAIVLAEKGDYVFITDVNQEAVEQLMTEYPENMFAMRMDVASLESCQEAKKQVIMKLTEMREAEATENALGLDAVLNFAGISVSGPMLELDPALYTKSFQVNLFGTYHVNQCFYPLMRSTFVEVGKEVNAKSVKSYPRFLLVSSEVGWARTSFAFTPYSTTKIALESYAVMLRSELSFLGDADGKLPTKMDKYDGYANVVVLNPGAMDTPLISEGVIMKHLESCPDSSYSKTLGLVDQFASGYIRMNKKNPSELAEYVYHIVHEVNPRTRYLYNVSKGMSIAAFVPQLIIDVVLAFALYFNGGPLRLPKQVCP